MTLRALCACLLAGFAAVPVGAAIPAGVNLLTNGSATDGATTGWNIIAAGGNGWATGGGTGYDGVGGYFITSFGLCQRSQTIDLLAAGATEAELDAAPPIRVSEAISSYLNNLADTYYIRVELRDASGTPVATWDAGTAAARKTAPSSWILESHEFREYGPGVRTIYFEDGGIDVGYWAGHYGTYHDAATVQFLNKPPTDITLTPAAFPANLPANGLVGQLRAVDDDTPTHTFALEAEAAVTTQALVTAGEAGWKYHDAGTAPSADWTTLGFDDSAWGSGSAPLGYDSNGADTWIVTPVSYGLDPANKPLTTWYRKTFTVADASAVVGLAATLMVDDGCVVYLNGQELFRDGLAPGDVNEFTAANRTVGGTDESDYGPIVIADDKTSLLVDGVNVIAVEVHQDKVTSSDTCIDLTLDAQVATPTNSYSNDLFTISGTELRVKAGSAALANGPYTVRVTARDGAGNKFVKLLTATRTATVSNKTPTALALSATAVPENTPAGALVGTFTPTDADAADAHAYAFVTGAGDAGNEAFVIADNRLLLARPLDYEAEQSLSIRVRVSDSVGLNFTRNFTIAVTDDTTEDADGDGLTEAEEDLNGNGILDAGETDPNEADTDGDGYNDRVERNGGSNPRDPNSFPSVVELLQIASHPTGSSWWTPESWENGQAPAAIHRTVTDALTLRTPPEPDPVFPGAAMELRNGAILRLKHTGLATVPSIIVRDSTIQHGMTVPISLGGPGATVAIPTAVTFDTAGQDLGLFASLSGAGSVQATGAAGGVLRLLTEALGFSGSITVNGPDLAVEDSGALGEADAVTVTAGTLRFGANVSAPSTLVTVSTGGRIALNFDVTLGGLVLEGVPVPAGTHTGAALISLGVPATAFEDNGGTLTVGGGPSDSVDSDGDGASDLAETLAGTNPNDARSVMRLSSVVPNGPGAWRLAWTSVAGITYTVQTSTTLTGPWQDLGTFTAAGTSATFDATPAAGSARFFRLAIK